MHQWTCAEILTQPESRSSSQQPAGFALKSDRDTCIRLGSRQETESEYEHGLGFCATTAVLLAAAP
jgi:hypothetical protein|eukprot:COSAG01_NODE_7043_length_3378_cov_5.714242_1_plen_66_part_00